MANVTGTATDAADLYAKLRAFLKTNATLVANGEAWTEVWDNGGGATGEFVLKGPGASGTDEIYVSFRLSQNVSTDAYFCELRGMTGIVPAGISVEDHVNVSPRPSIFFLDESPMTYWFIANGRRFMVVVKITTIFEMAYAGFILPYGLPTEYPYPMFIGASACEATTRPETPKQWRDYVENHSGFPWPVCYANDYLSRGLPAHFILDPAGNWLTVGNTGGGDSQVNVGPAYTRGAQFTADDANAFTFEKLKVNARIMQAYGGGRSVTPISLFFTNGGNQIFGVFDGVLKCQGYLMGAEDRITVNGADHLVVQNVFRTDLFDYVAMELN